MCKNLIYFYTSEYLILLKDTDCPFLPDGRFFCFGKSCKILSDMLVLYTRLIVETGVHSVMKKERSFLYILSGFALGVLLTTLVWLGVGSQTSAGIISGQKENQRTDLLEHTVQTLSGDSSASGEKAAELSVLDWDNAAVYNGGDMVSYQGRSYRAKWWTQGEKPDVSDVWEDLGVLAGQPIEPMGTQNVPIDAKEPQDVGLYDFKVVAYYPSWKPDKLQYLDFAVVTHVCYAFAIPTADGGLRDLENPLTVKALIESAHKNGAKVLLSVGGWSYNDVPLEPVFMDATSDDTKIRRFAANIVAMCDEYGFDGVDMDWEHPRVDGSSARQYEKLMLVLAEQLHAQDKLLTAAVLSGATADGNIYYDAAAHTNAVLNAVDFINVMAYDGGDGERHSQYDFAVNCAEYWKETRGLPACKVVLGVPFYARPSWAAYGAISQEVPGADRQDSVLYNGMNVYYNGVPTIEVKTKYARQNLGGVMIWEVTQDSPDKAKSLLQAIGRAAA